MTSEVKDGAITINGTTFDLRGVLPLKIRDWRELEKKGVKLNEQAGSASITNLSVMAQHILKKANPEIADDFVDDLSIAEVVSISTAASEAEEKSLDRPT